MRHNTSGPFRELAPGANSSQNRKDQRSFAFVVDGSSVRTPDTVAGFDIWGPGDALTGWNQDFPSHLRDLEEITTCFGV